MRQTKSHFWLTNTTNTVLLEGSQRNKGAILPDTPHCSSNTCNHSAFTRDHTETHTQKHLAYTQRAEDGVVKSARQ